MVYRRFEKYDKVWIGILAGLLAPIFWYFIWLSIYDGIETMGWIEPGAIGDNFRQRTSALVAICLNILPLQIFKTQYMDRAMRGIVFPTVLYVGVWLYFFASSVL